MSQTFTSGKVSVSCVKEHTHTLLLRLDKKHSCSQLKINSTNSICPEAWRWHEKSLELHIKKPRLKVPPLETKHVPWPSWGSESTVSTIPNLEVSYGHQRGQGSERAPHPWPSTKKMGIGLLVKGTEVETDDISKSGLSKWPMALGKYPKLGKRSESPSSRSRLRPPDHFKHQTDTYTTNQLR